MILKMFNELTNNYVLVDKVDSVKMDQSNWAIHANPNAEVVNILQPVMVGYAYIAQEGEVAGSSLQSRFIPMQDAPDEVKDCPDFVLAKNTNVFSSMDECFVMYHKRYTTADVYIAKLIYATIGDTVKVFMLGFNHPVFVLNDSGKTVERM